MDCVTPSHPDPIPYGESLDIYQLLQHPLATLKSSDSRRHSTAIKWQYSPRTSVLEGGISNFEYLDAQITKGERRPSSKKASSTKSSYSKRPSGAPKSSSNITKIDTMDRASTSLPFSGEKIVETRIPR